MNSQQIRVRNQQVTDRFATHVPGNQEIAAKAIEALWEIALQLAKITERMPERDGA